MAERRTHILAAAERCFARRGYRATSIPDICQEAQVSVGAIYTHFESKESIVEAMAAEAMAAKGAMFAETDDDTTLANSDYLRDLLRSLYGRDGRRTAQLDLNLWSESTRNDQLRASVKASIRQVVQHLAALTSNGKRKGELDSKLDARAFAHLLTAAGLGLEVMRAMDVGPSRSEAQRALEALIPHGGRS